MEDGSKTVSKLTIEKARNEFDWARLSFYHPERNEQERFASYFFDQIRLLLNASARANPPRLASVALSIGAAIETICESHGLRPVVADQSFDDLNVYTKRQTFKQWSNDDWFNRRLYGFTEEKFSRYRGTARKIELSYEEPRVAWHPFPSGLGHDPESWAEAIDQIRTDRSRHELQKRRGKKPTKAKHIEEKVF